MKLGLFKTFRYTPIAMMKIFRKKNTYNLNVLRNNLAVALIDIMGHARTFIFFFTF